MQKQSQSFHIAPTTVPKPIETNQQSPIVAAKGTSALLTKNPAPPMLPASQHGSPVVTPPGPSDDLIVSPAEAEIRRDYIYEEYAIIAPGRHNRPFDMRADEHPLIETANSPRLDDQPIIASLNIGKTPHKVRVVGNKFPALDTGNPKAYGQQEIVIDTQYANTPLGTLDTNEIGTVLTMYRNRIAELSKQPHIKYVQVFKNDGHHAGASLAHAHTQIFALPIVPPLCRDHLLAIQAYIQANESNPYDDIIAFETKAQERLIGQNTSAASIAPYASRWPLEAWIIPTSNAQSFGSVDDQQIRDIAILLQKILHKLHSKKIDYNFFIEQGLQKEQRWVLKVYGRDVVSPMGGLEVSTGIMINTIPPEAAAKWYRS